MYVKWQLCAGSNFSSSANRPVKKNGKRQGGPRYTDTTVVYSSQIHYRHDRRVHDGRVCYGHDRRKMATRTKETTIT